MVRSRKLALALVAVATFAAPAYAADSAAVAAAKTFVADQQKTVTRVMHPTAKLMSVDPVEVSESAVGFTLVATYRFKGSLSELFYSKMAFSFDANGRFARVTTRETTSFVRPFTAANAGMAVVREMVAKELELKKDSPVKAALGAVTAQAALDVFLKAKQSAVASR